ncbi:MAG: matrixin family metalloprotease [Kofleriaceae bacterium]
MRASLFAIVVVASAPVQAQSPDELAAITAAPCDADREHCFGVRLHIAFDQASLVVAPAWVRAQLAEANRHFAPLGVGFQLTTIDTASSLHVRTRGDRKALGAKIGGTVIDVFVTGKLDDVDVPGAVARGVTLRRGAHKYIILASYAPNLVLAHELGHLFGLPHSSYPISIMNKTKRAAPSIEQRTFADEEIRMMRAKLAQLIRDRVLVNVRTP